MKSTDAPSLIATPFAQNGTRNDIPASDPGFSGDDAGRAAFATGFPDITMRPITAGGKPPFGADFNGILYALSNAARYYGAGGHYRFNGSFAAAIAGYPIGATVQASDGMGHWLNVVDANGTDPESALSTGWIPLSDHNGTATVNLTGNVALSASQAAKANIRLTGNIKGNLTVTFPAWTKRYSIINDCTGDQSVICTTGNGESISIKNGAKYEIGCDGKNLTVATVNASQVFAEPNKNVSSLDAPTVQQVINALGSAAKHNEGDFERTGVAADLDDKLWKLITANYVGKSGGTYDGVINAPAPARGDRGSAVANAWWCGQEFDVKGAADAVQRNLDKVNDEAWKGINDAWAKANDAQDRVSFYEWLMGGSGDRNFWYIGDRLGVNSLLQQEAGYLTAKYGGKTTFRVTPGGLIDFGSIDWTHVENKYVVGEGDETGIVRMNGGQNIWDVNAKNYAASQYQARQAQETGVKAQQGVDSLKDIISKPYNDYLYLGGTSDKAGGAIIKNEAGWLSSLLNGIATFQVNPDGLITKGSIDVSKVVNDYDSGPGYIKNKKTGLIIQFGFASNSNKNEVIQKFPLYFSSRNYVVVASDLGPGGGGNIWADWKETGQCRLGENNSPNIYVQYIAIGY